MNINLNVNISFKNIFNNITVVIEGRWIQITASVTFAISCAVASWFLLPL